MLRSVKDLENCTIGATDGTIGRVQDLYFDDEEWAIRYLVVEAGDWLVNRTVLISSYSVCDWDWGGTILPVSISREQVEHSPVIDTNRPVSRQHETNYLGYYGYPVYWGSADPEGAVGSRGARPGADEDPHLRSCNAVSHYHVHAADGDVGHVQGYLIDDNTWVIRFLIVSTSNWWLGHEVLIAAEWIEDISWADSTVTADLTRRAVQDSPAYDAAVPVSEAAEATLYEHYGRRAPLKDELHARAAAGR